MKYIHNGKVSLFVAWNKMGKAKGSLSSSAVKVPCSFVLKKIHK